MFIIWFIVCIYKKLCTISFPQNNEGFDTNEKSVRDREHYITDFILQIEFEPISEKQTNKPTNPYRDYLRYLKIALIKVTELDLTQLCQTQDLNFLFKKKKTALTSYLFEKGCLERTIFPSIMLGSCFECQLFNFLLQGHYCTKNQCKVLLYSQKTYREISTVS